MIREEAINYLMNISYQLGTTSIEYLSEKDGEKMREAIKALEQEPCNDCISRQAAIDAVTKTSGIRGDALKALYDLPPVKPEQKSGKWEYVQYDGNPKIGNFHCSQCHGIGKTYYDYCPNCGAKMDVPDTNVGDKAESEE